MSNTETAYHQYLRWKSKILSATDPKTDQEFADRYTVSLPDIAEFTRRPEYSNDLRTTALAWLESKIPELLHVAYQEAKQTKNVNDIQKLVDIAFELRKKDKEVKSMNQYNFFANTLTNEQIKRIAERSLRGNEELPAPVSAN